MIATSFKTEFAVSMECEACVKDIQSILQQQPNIQKVDISLPDQSVVVEGFASPSLISRALKASGRQVIVRGMGTSGTPAGAAVCIFEAYTPPPSSPVEGDLSGTWSQKVHGIARMVQTSEEDDGVCVLDLTIRHVALVANVTTMLEALGDTKAGMFVLPSTGGRAGVREDNTRRFKVYVAESGDVSEGARSTGGMKRELGEVDVNAETGYGDMLIEIPRLQVWEIIGHAMVVAPIVGDGGQVGEGILAGVIARSAGAWGNDKRVCACSGQTMWEENRMSIQANL